MKVNSELIQELQEPFSAKDIEWRVQRTVKVQGGQFKAIVIPYLTNRAIQSRLDEVFGVFGWKNSYKKWGDNGVLCGISVRDNLGDWITKWDGAEETNFESVKGGLSNASKRAAVTLGIGRYLYDIDEYWVEIKDKGQNYINAKVKVQSKEESKEEWVKGYWDNPILPDWALPAKEKRNNVNKENQKPSNGNGASPKTINPKLVAFVKDMENELELNADLKLRIYMRANPESTLVSVENLYGHHEAELSRYLTLIKSPAQFKRYVANKDINLGKLYQFLSGRLNVEVKSFLTLIGLLDDTLFNELKEMIEREVA